MLMRMELITRTTTLAPKTTLRCNGIKEIQLRSVLKSKTEQRQVGHMVVARR